MHMRMLESRDVPEVSRLLACALHDDPAYAYLLPGTSAFRQASLQQFFAGNLRVHLPFGCTRVLCEPAGRVVATVTLRPPGGVKITPAAMLQHGLVPFTLRNGPRAVQRMLRLKSIYETFERTLGRGEPFWHLHMMGVLPEEQGKGRGSAMLRELMDAVVDRDAGAHATALSTHKQRNVLFYQRAGFETVSEQALQIPRGPSYRAWGMRRDRRS